MKGRLEVWSVQGTKDWGDEISLHKYIRGKDMYWDEELFELNDSGGEQVV